MKHPSMPRWNSTRIALAAAILFAAVPAHAASRIPASCLPLARTPGLIDCYLSHPENLNLARNIKWSFKVSLQWTTKEWKDWPESAKADLRKEYVAAVSWYEGGMGVYPIAQSPDPPVSLNASLLMHEVWVDAVRIAESDAWSIYKGHVAIQLAAEMHSWIPWSIKDTDASHMPMMLGPFMPPSGAGFAVQGITPAHASTVFRFLKQNNLIGPTKADTIARVIDWCRYHLAHYFGGGTWRNAFEHWQHWGRPPVSRIIEGTINTNPDYVSFGKRHWTAGCSGTTQFLKAVLRTVNIVVQPRGLAGHNTPTFPSEGLALSHGDDPYNATTLSNYPASMLLITTAQYQAWFPAGDFAITESNVGRRPTELALEYPGSPWILTRYCDDVWNGRSHAASRVYNETFKFHYTLAETEASGVWTKLAQITGCTQRN